MIFFFFLWTQFNTVLYSSTPEKIINIWQIKRVGIIRAMKFETGGIRFLGDVISAIAIVA